MDARRLTVNCSILFTDLPRARRPQAARDAGFRAVEFWWPFPSTVPTDGEVEQFITEIDDAGVRLTHLNLAAGDLAAGDRGILSDPQHSAEFRDSVDIALGIGTRLGVVGFNALYGNRLDSSSVTVAAQDEVATANLAYAARSMATIGADILIEPLSAIPRYPLLRAADADAVAERVERDHGHRNVRLLADLYHLAVNDDDLDDVLADPDRRIGHVQIADAPGRGAPGTGSMDIRRHLATLENADYPGWISLEYRATGSDPFAWISEFDSPTTEQGGNR